MRFAFSFSVLQRVYEKYGGLVLDTHGMTSSGVERKATCQALFKKLHYLTTEVEDLIPQARAGKWHIRGCVQQLLCGMACARRSAGCYSTTAIEGTLRAHIMPFAVHGIKHRAAVGCRH